jgi:hypothetical protein
MPLDLHWGTFGILSFCNVTGDPAYSGQRGMNSNWDRNFSPPEANKPFTKQSGIAVFHKIVTRFYRISFSQQS